MKKIRIFMVIVVLVSCVFSMNVFAAENSICQYNENRSYNPDYKRGDVTSYKCPKSSCRAYLIYQYPVGNCEYRDSKTHAYTCSHCSDWYCICESGHFNHVDGR